MSVLVVNSNHWIGYHLIDALLELEYTVEGIVDESEDDDVTLFFGRNSNFRVISKIKDKQYKACFILGDGGEGLPKIQAEKVLIIPTNASNKKVEFEKGCTIYPPLLYGEWMPMEEDGFYLDEEWIPFHSDRFKEEAVYIKLFIDCLIQFMKNDRLPPSVNILSKDAKQEDEAAIYIRESGNQEEKLKQVLQQYKKWNNINKF